MKNKIYTEVEEEAAEAQEQVAQQCGGEGEARTERKKQR